MNWYSASTILYTRSCSNFCSNGVYYQPGYALQTICCQGSNCNSGCQSTFECNHSNRRLTLSKLLNSFIILLFIIYF